MTRSIVIEESQLELIICLTISFCFVVSERAFPDLVESCHFAKGEAAYGRKEEFFQFFLCFHVEYNSFY
jgi:hypothetical protein